jgi:hypothetical protein
MKKKTKSKQPKNILLFMLANLTGIMFICFTLPENIKAFENNMSLWFLAIGLFLIWFARKL